MKIKGFFRKVLHSLDLGLAFFAGIFHPQVWMIYQAGQEEEEKK